ncbi:monooxygenase [Mycolicibacterium chitae]|uniref:FAD dependent oxidoreductase n=1 Tax=Mycolicibacterium chitae TaxID=1792 RepID=A0A448IAZ6_MYCCI|nr:NAD(P)/FAD-dependent oxidoreductase [Mycolicibacterium chitae]MCV7108532.1 NAD(P)/FAD-dependent oxidoreductase [Mycolicibacterium chitae]BBZ00764.1 monooxygenase [Mycolicibacterium chitae]VEG49612.1 FAD dependent oxidoreductase [Mycolicibacterium chitae]
MKATQPQSAFDAGVLREALQEASIPTLLPILVQLTGDERWISEEFRVGRPVGFVDDPTGGLAEEKQREVRAAAGEAIQRWSAGAAVQLPNPDDGLLARLMSAAMGQRVSEAYSPMIAEQIGLRPFTPDPVQHEDRLDVAVIGAGVSGIVMARALKAAGIAYTVYEKNDEVGGTWWENRYPGARVDVPSSLYSFSFATKPWSEHFSRRDEIADYMIATADELGIRDSIRFGHDVTAAHWDDAAQRWRLTVVADGKTREVTAGAVITAVGLHNRPKYPDIAGLDTFAGEVVHSAAWPEGLDLTGRRVGVIGAGASAMQVVAATVEATEHLAIFQRSPHWIVPNDIYFQPVSDKLNWLLANVPLYWEWNRFRLYWIYTEGMFPALVVDPEWDRSKNSVNGYSEAIRRFYTGYLEQKLPGRPDLIARTTPDFPPFGRRILLDNGWFDALVRSDVDLVTEPIDRVEESGIVTADGVRTELDIIVLCTGFQQQRYLYPLEVVGRGGRSLRDEWHDDDARAYLGLTTPGYPNLFYLFGPNTNPPGGSYINLAEAQARYVVELLAAMVADGITAVDCREDVFADYNRRLDEANAKMVFAQEGVDSYYRNSTGRVVTNSPWTVLQYWTMTRHPNLDDYHVSTAGRQRVSASAVAE